jgi:hypothetical protein
MRLLEFFQMLCLGMLSVFFLACFLNRICVQISEQFEALGAIIKVQCAVVVGGIDMVSQVVLPFLLLVFYSFLNKFIFVI